MTEDHAPGIFTRVFHATLLILGSVVAIYLALQLLSEIWGWLLLLAAVGAVGWALLRLRRYRADRW